MLKELPCSIEAEAAVLGACILSHGEVKPQISDLTPIDFIGRNEYGTHSDIFKAIQESQTVDMMSVISWLKENSRNCTPSYISKLMECAEIANVRWHADKIKEKSRLRQIYAAAANMQIEIENGGKASDRIVSEYEEKLFSISQNKTTDTKHIRDIMGDFLRRVEQYRDKGILGELCVKSGITDFDELTGGFVPGSLIVLAGRPSMGKTTLANKLLLNIASQNKPVLFCSYELPEMMLAQRTVSIEGNIGSNVINHGPIDDDCYARIIASAGNVSNLKIEVSLKPEPVQEIKHKAIQLIKKYGKLGAIEIDRIEMIAEPFTPGENRTQYLGRISMGLNMLAIEIDTPIILLMQLSRECEKRENKRPMLSDLRDSGTLEQDAKMVIFVYRDEYYHAESKLAGTGEVIVAKNMFGGTGIIKTSFRRDIPTFDNLEPWRK